MRLKCLTQARGSILLELLALVGLITLSTGFVFLNTDALWQHYHKQQLRFCAQLLAADLRQLQQEALFPADTSSRDIRINPEKNGYFWTLKGSAVKAVHFTDYACEQVYFSSFLAKLSFSNNGAPSVNGYYRLQHKELASFSYQVDVQPITGRVLAYATQ